MTLISKLKSLLGMDAGRPERGGTTVSVEPEPRAETERAVKESSAPGDGESTESADASATVEASETGADDSAAGSDESVQSMSGIGPAYAERLAEAGVETVGDLANADAAELASATGLGEARVSTWIEQAHGD